MATREHLHRLLDSLPEEAIEAAYRTLSLFQVCPPQLPQFEELRHTYDKRWKEVQEAQRGQTDEVSIAGVSIELPLDQTPPTLSSGYWSFDYLEADTLVVETHRYRDCHELAIVERISIQDEPLVYGHEITGPQGKREQREIIFDIS